MEVALDDQCNMCQEGPPPSQSGLKISPISRAFSRLKYTRHNPVVSFRYLLWRLESNNRYAELPRFSILKNALLRALV